MIFKIDCKSLSHREGSAKSRGINPYCFPILKAIANTKAIWICIDQGANRAYLKKPKLRTRKRK